MKNKTKLRFVSDYNLPIQVVDEPYFSYFLELYEPYNGAKTKYIELVKVIDNDFGGDEDSFLSEYYKVRDLVIKSTLENEAYKRFNTSDMNQYKIATNKYPANTNIYNQNDVGKMFLSIDLVKANFQALNFVDKNILNSSSYCEFISRFTDLKYFKESKYTRQVIFGQLNPGRTTTIEKFLMYKIVGILETNDLCHGIRSVTNDEIIIEFQYKIHTEVLETIEDLIFETLGISVRVEHFRLENIGDTQYIMKRYLNSDNFKITGVPMNLFAQVYKKAYNLELNHDMDLIFYNDKMLAKYLKPI